MLTMVNQEIIQQINETAKDHIEDILLEFGADIDNIVDYGNRVQSTCPVHLGDNKSAFSFFKDNNAWMCFTRGCQEGNYGIIGLVKCLLQRDDETKSYGHAIQWLLRFLKIDSNAEPLDEEEIEILKLNSIGRGKKRKVNIDNVKTKFPLPIELIKDKVPPSKFFLQQGFTEDILRKYHVGYCSNPHKPMFHRGFIPVLSQDGENILGVTGRTTLPKCDFCPLFHEQGQGCPHENKKVFGQCKWKHFGFESQKCLFNQNFAAPYIQKSKLAIICEGVKECIFLEQHGIHNSVCVFGIRISTYHIKRLIEMGCSSIVLGFDRDTAGDKSKKDLKERLDNYFKIYDINIVLKEGEDIDDLNQVRIEEDLKPFLAKIY